MLTPTLAWTSPASGQAAASDGPLTPVDQAVEDIGPRSTSLRAIDPGNAQFSPRARVYRLDANLAPLWSPQLPQLSAEQFPYVYVGRGVQAIMPRGDYLVRPRQTNGEGIGINEQPNVDGEFAEMMPAGAVYNLIPTTPAQGVVGRAEWGSADPPSPIEDRLDAQVDFRVHAQRLGAIPLDEDVFPPLPVRRVLRPAAAEAANEREAATAGHDAADATGPDTSTARDAGVETDAPKGEPSATPARDASGPGD